MLVMFRTKNYNSFKDDAILDLRSAKYVQHQDHTFKALNHDLLKTVAIYGANASGKSNFISSISNFNTFIKKQLYTVDLEEEEVKEYRNFGRPFSLDDNNNDEIEYEIVFINKGIQYQYGYSVKENIIATEWLFIDDQCVFERDNSKDNNIKFGEKYKKVLRSYKKSREDRLYIATLDYFMDDKDFIEKINVFEDFIKYKLNIYFEITLDVSVKVGIPSYYTPIARKLMNNEDLIKKISEYISKIDVGINEIIVDVKEVISRKDEGEEVQKLIPTLMAVHNKYNSYGEVIGTEKFDFTYESTGTAKFVSLIESVLDMLEQGGVFIIDELSARLHPLVTKFIIDIFQSNINEKNAQLVFTTHDTFQMNKEQFRRDEIVLVDKNEKGESTIYSLADMDVRSDASFDKDYIKGKYGALPIVQSDFN